MTSPRKRFSAFEDFPGTGETAVRPQIPPETAPQDPGTPVERIERLRPSEMLPDRFQPRRLLPARLRLPFFSGQSGCYQTAAAWLEFAGNSPAEMAEIERLLAMGESFDEHGQIKPITGAWVAGRDGRYVFQIETGERRFWAACLRRVKTEAPEEPLLRVEVVSRPTRQRQVLENRHSEPPSAVGQACEIAALILAELGVAPDLSVPDDFDYFRQVHSMRMPAGLWDRIMPVMQLTRPRMVQLLNLLQMKTALLEEADRARLPERVLREIIARPSGEWPGLVRSAIVHHLTSDDLAALDPGPTPGTNRPAGHRGPQPYDPGRSAAAALRRFGFILGDLDPHSQDQALDQVADSLVVHGEAEGMIAILGELARLIDARLGRR